MKNLLNKIERFNFKVGFLAILGAFLIFAIIGTSIQLSNGRWGDGVAYHQHRLDEGQHRGRRGHSNTRRHNNHRRGENEAYYANEALADNPLAPTRNIGDKVVYTIARHYVRFTSPDFGVMELFGMLLRVAFITLVSLWVYADSKKNSKNPAIWAIFTFLTHGVGWVVYMVVRTRNKKSIEP